MTSLEVVAGGRRFVFRPLDVISIGRNDDSQVQLSDRIVGRIHARVAYRDGTWVLNDEDSRNGTWLAGERISTLRIDAPVTVSLGSPTSGTTLSLAPIPESDGTPIIDHPVGLGVASGEPKAGGSSAVLVVRLDGEQRIFPVGARVEIGRDPSLELVTTNPLVSRGAHGFLTSDQGGAVYTDTSSRGTFLNGKRLQKPLRITESVVLRLGDPATGEELAVTPPLSAKRLYANKRRRTAKARARVGAAIFLVVAVVTGSSAALAGVFSGGSPNAANPAALSPASLAGAEAATVRLLQGTPDNYVGWGSGTLISANGLILTNGHVAEPQAAGEAVNQGVPGSTLDPNPPFLTVELTTGQSSPVVARYQARPVAVDGYLDLAVVQIDATADGQPLNPASLRLPFLPLGNVNDVQLDQPVTVLGFPGVAESDSITVTNGTISTFVPDPLGHVTDPRFELETTARIAHGNSGGAAINNAGQLIGIPSLTVSGEDTDVSYRLRSVAEASPLIAAAKNGTAYQSHLLVPSASAQRIDSIGIGLTEQAACSGGQNVGSGASALFFGVNYSGFPVGIDVALSVELSDGSLVQPLPQSILTSSSGCLSMEIDSPAALGDPQWPDGTYPTTLLAGPNLDPLSDSNGGNPVSLSVGGSPP
jgi:putative serine protease PepD